MTAAAPPCVSTCDVRREVLCYVTGVAHTYFTRTPAIQAAKRSVCNLPWCVRIVLGSSGLYGVCGRLSLTQKAVWHRGQLLFCAWLNHLYRQAAWNLLWHVLHSCFGRWPVEACTIM